ncbi:MAG: EAL domain-containing protein, partial [Actinomycetales bacterium]|nr:EAL domain-containing protein [Actinomycetales bacterium]
DIDRDPARQALVSGMRHFANLTNTLLLGEGVETAAEADTLRALGVDLGQGYYFGRPAPARSFA